MVLDPQVPLFTKMSLFIIPSIHSPGDDFKQMAGKGESGENFGALVSLENTEILQECTFVLVPGVGRAAASEKLQQLTVT